MRPIVFLLAAFVACTSANSLSFRASPKVAVEDITEELSFQCKPPSSVNRRVFVAVLINLQKTDENGTKSTVVSQTVNRLQYGDEDDNRTSATANVQQSETGEASFLDVTIAEPVPEDTGMYECRFVYVDVDYEVHLLASAVNITVVEVPPPNYEPEVVGSLEERMDCACGEIWEEIDNIKATLVMENKRLKSEVGSYDETCRVSFSAQLNKDFPPRIAPGDLRFSEVTNNKGNAYDAETGVFVAPCAGQYYFTLTLRSWQSMDSGYVYGHVMVDGSSVARTAIFTDAPFDNYQSATNGVIVALKEGQQVKVSIKTTSSGEFIAEDFSIFSGYFLFP